MRTDIRARRRFPLRNEQTSYLQQLFARGDRVFPAAAPRFREPCLIFPVSTSICLARPSCSHPAMELRRPLYVGSRTGVINPPHRRRASRPFTRHSRGMRGRQQERITDSKPFTTSSCRYLILHGTGTPPERVFGAHAAAPRQALTMSALPILERPLITRLDLHAPRAMPRAG